MHNKLCTILLGTLLLCSCLLFMAASPQAFASTYSSSVSNSSYAQNASPSYNQGFRQGHDDAVYDCRHNTHRAMRQHHGKGNDYDHGYRDGYNNARTHDRACTRHR